MAMAMGPNGDLTSCPQGVIDTQHDIWAKLWKEGAPPPQTNPWPVDLGTLPPMSGTQLRAVSQSFSRTTTAIDGWHPRHFGQLSEKCLTALAQLFQSFEAGPFWPKQQQSLMVRLLDKPSNDQEGWTKDKRPILLFRSLFRLWAKARQRLIRD